MRNLFRIGRLTLIALAILSKYAYAEDDSSLEYPIVAAYIYNFTQFTTWPANAPHDHFLLCILGTNPFGELLTPLKNKTARGSNFTLRYVASPNNTLSSCDALFITPSESGHAKEIIASLKNAPVLTISNTEHFATSGGMVELTKEDEKISMQINNTAVMNAGLSISSKLLSLARIVNSE